jgi:hypothetical protein
MQDSYPNVFLFLYNFIDCTARYSTLHSCSLVALHSGNSNCICAFSLSHSSIMLATISLPSYELLCLSLCLSLSHHKSLHTLHIWLKSVYSNSTAVHMHHTPYCNINSICTNGIHGTKLRLSVLGTDAL